MNWPFSRSLRQKLVGIVLLTTLAALVVALAAIVAYDLNSYRRNWASDLNTQAELIGQSTAPAIEFDDRKVAGETLALLRLRPRVQAAAVYTARGVLFASYRRANDHAPFPALPGNEGTRIDGARMIIFKRIVGHGEILGTLYLSTDYELYARLRDYVGIALVAMMVAMATAFLLSAQLQRVITRPILAVADIARALEADADYTRRAQKLSDDEVGVLVDSFNGMLVEIERRTSELEVANAELERQVAERQRAETEVLRLNAELEDRVRDRTSQLEAANQELEAFSYSVSHDLRAPLRAIDGFGQALVDDFPASLPDEAQRYLSRIRASTLRMGQLIEDLLNLSRVSRSVLQRMPVDVGEVAAQVVSDLRQRDPERHVEVSVWSGMDAEADPRLLRAALENLIGNSWKFTGHTEKPRIEIGALRDGNQRIFYVRDNGSGFDMAYADKLFTAFQRLHSADEFSGTGIGLATVQRIVHRHGGRIWADAQVGKGATFFFTLAGN